VTKFSDDWCVALQRCWIK